MYPYLWAFSVSHLNSFVFAKSSVPDWFQNYKTVYPDKDYIAQRGSGDSEETAKTDALAQIARYFQTQVNANLTTSIVSISQGENLIEETKIKSSVKYSQKPSQIGV